jgi:hypothetical protein
LTGLSRRSKHSVAVELNWNMADKSIRLQIKPLVDGYFFDVMTVFLVSALFTPLFFLDIFRKNVNDYKAHIAWAAMIGTDIIKIPGGTLAHSLWQYLVFIVHQISSAPYKQSAFLVTLGSVALTGWILYREFVVITDRTAWSRWRAVGLSIAILLVNPICILALGDHYLYLGYLAMNSFHNPTSLLLKPIALLQFIYTLHAFNNPKISVREIVITAVLSILSAYAKPSFTICLLPALGIMVIIYWFKKQTIHWNLLIWGICLPSAIVLFAQFLLSYTGNQEDSIIFSLFGVMHSTSNYLFAKLLLSITFPMLLTIFYRKRIMSSPKMLLAWICFIVGAFYSYFLAESGPHFRDGNFVWSGEIAIFILFFASTAFFLEEIVKSGIIKNIFQKVISGAWVLHLVSGIVYLLYSILTNGYY